MYCVFKEPLVTQKSRVKNEELDKKATKQCVLSSMSTEYGFNQYHAFTECMGVGNSIQKDGCRRIYNNRKLERTSKN